MLGFNLVPDDINLRFISKRKAFFIFSAVLVAVSVALFTLKGLSYGIDFQGGIMIEVRMSEAGAIGDMRRKLSDWTSAR